MLYDIFILMPDWLQCNQYSHCSEDVGSGEDHHTWSRLRMESDNISAIHVNWSEVIGGIMLLLLTLENNVEDQLMSDNFNLKHPECVEFCC